MKQGVWPNISLLLYLHLKPQLTFQSHKALLTTFQLKRPSDKIPVSSLSRRKTISLSKGVRNLALSGQSWTIQMDAIPTTKESKPSMMNCKNDVLSTMSHVIHVCTYNPRPTSFTTGTIHSTQSICDVQYLVLASHDTMIGLHLHPKIPPKAPARTAPAKKREIRLEASLRLYQPERKNEIPGKRPLSAIPKQNLIAKSCP